MDNVGTIAEQYGTSTKFLLHALAKVGVPAETADSLVSDDALARFEAAFGDRIRSAKPTPAQTPDPTAPVARPTRPPRPHVIRVAHTKIGGGRDMRTMVRSKVLADDPGPAHAIDASGSREGDPWRAELAPGAHSFYEFQGPRAACGVQVKVVMGDGFDPERADACPKCVDAVVAGKAFRSAPWERPSDCATYVRIVEDDAVTVAECDLREGHRGPHRTYDGATWETGPKDYTPALGGRA